MPAIPKDNILDSTIYFLKDPYRFLMKRSERHQSDIFELRLLAKRTVALKGHKYAKYFYDASLCSRDGMPELLRSTLLGRGGVNSLKGEEHLKRKALFMSCMSKEEVYGIGNILKKNLEMRFLIWEASPQVHLLQDIQFVLACSAIEWVGIPLQDFGDLEKATKKLVSLFDDAGAKSFRHVRARYSRWFLERKIRKLVRFYRRPDNIYKIDAQSPFAKILLYRDVNDEALSEKVASVEILNLLRPIVAVSCFISFATHAFLTHKNVDLKRIVNDEKYRNFFIDEVRRYYPFFPAVIGQAKKDYSLEGFKINKGTRLVLDIYGTNHDPRVWKNPEEFNPLRFEEQAVTPYNLVAQGGGDHSMGHRCAGEFITKRLMSVYLEKLLSRVDFHIPDQDMRIQMTRVPATPRSGVALDRVSIVEQDSNKDFHVTL